MSTGGECSNNTILMKTELWFIELKVFHVQRKIPYLCDRYKSVTVGNITACMFRGPGFHAHVKVFMQCKREKRINILQYVVHKVRCPAGLDKHGCVISIANV